MKGTKGAPTGPELRTYLKDRLPDYMVPASYVFLPALPLTRNGKVDRAALPVPEPSRPELDRSYVGPRNATEEKLIESWADVLGLDRIGVHDNFFDLGGHSLLATQVISRLRTAFHVELPLIDFFDTPNVADLSRTIDAILWAREGMRGHPDAGGRGFEAGEI